MFLKKGAKIHPGKTFFESILARFTFKFPIDEIVQKFPHLAIEKTQSGDQPIHLLLGKAGEFRANHELQEMFFKAINEIKKVDKDALRQIGSSNWNPLQAFISFLSRKELETFETEILKMLLVESNDLLDVKDDRRYTALANAALNGHIYLVDALLKAGASIHEALSGFINEKNRLEMANLLSSRKSAL